ncbi:MAG TPA: hypothetical protein VF365_08260 [Candidatus Limnocylindria bacterium]
MSTSLRPARFLAALVAAAAATGLLAGTALAHPESEGDHAGGCIVTVEPGTITVGQEFTVEGNFGGASIFIVAGEDGVIAEDAEPDATTPLGDSFSVTFTALGPATYTVWGMIVGSECGDSDTLVVSAVPDTALPTPAVPGTSLVLVGLLLLVPAAAVGAARLARHRR